MEKNAKMNRKVLITGASRGIGRATALHLANEGYALLLHASREASLQPLIASLPAGTRYEVLTADFSEEDALKQFTGTLKKANKDLYGIVSNAGIALDKALVFQPQADIDNMIRVNLMAPILLAKAAMKIFPRNGEGVFLGIGSCVGEMGNAFQSVYAATKAANVALIKSLAQEVGQLHGSQTIRFLTLSPGFIQTDMVESLSEEIQADFLSKIPSRRAGTPAEVAQTIAFLLRDEAAYINGSEIKINGGLA